MTIHPDVIRKYSRPVEVATFLETGTYQGTTTLEATRCNFNRIETVELSLTLYNGSKRRFAELGMSHLVKFHHGFSPLFLEQVLPTVEGSAFIYLDAHFSGPTTSGFGQPLPLWDELQAIYKAGRHLDVIAIDDIRLCGTDEHPGWKETTLQILVEALQTINSNYVFNLEPGIVPGDVLVAHPGLT